MLNLFEYQVKNLTASPILTRRVDYGQPAWSPAYFIVPLVGAAVRRAIASHAVSADRGFKALDVGCGEQPFRSCTESAGYQYHGMDVTQNSKGTVDLIGAIDQPLSPAVTALAPADLVLCTEVLVHVVDLQTAFSNLSRLMRPGAAVIISCPFLFPLHEEPDDFWRPTRYALQSLAAKHQFRVVEEESLGEATDVLGTVLAGIWLGPWLCAASDSGGASHLRLGYIWRTF